MRVQGSDSSEPVFPAAGRTMVVLSHPNHEAAVFGIVQRLRPRIVFLTDGGGGERVGQSRRALEQVGLLSRACFLNFKENEFYRALLDRDLAFFSLVVDRLREQIEASPPEQVLCDAVEFYNPVHDLSLPVLSAALGKKRDIPIFELPLIYQTAASDETYEIQRFPPSRRARQILFHLSPQELEVKHRMRDQVYSLLRLQLAPMLSLLPPDYLGTEVIAPAAPDASVTEGEQTLRYEWRARLLQQRGAIDRVITYADHYRPTAAALVQRRIDCD